MGKIEDYADGSILDGIELALKVLGDSESELSGNPLTRHIHEKISEFRPKIASISEASELISQASSVAIGERICHSLHPGSVATYSVFLDELAVAMTEADKAKAASAEEAIRALQAHPDHPLVMSSVSGKYQEICASCPSECVFWKAGKKGLQIWNR
jgi:hypothetical protein